MRKLYIHIGTHKTGTTSIQSFLRKNSDVLSQYGIYIPISGTISNASGHHNIAWQLRGDQRFNPQKGQLDSLIREIKEADHLNAIISSEDFEYLVQYPDIIRQFEEIIKNEGWQPQYIIFFRNQENYSESLYSELLKHGLKITYGEFVEQILNEDYFVMKTDWRFYFNYCTFVKNWSSAAKGRLIVHDFDKAAGGDGIVSTLLKTLGVSLSEGTFTGFGERLNVSGAEIEDPYREILSNNIKRKFTRSNRELKKILQTKGSGFLPLTGFEDGVSEGSRLRRLLRLLRLLR